jgi:hypothetical protein
MLLEEDSTDLKSDDIGQFASRSDNLLRLYNYIMVVVKQFIPLIYAHINHYTRMPFLCAPA